MTSSVLSACLFSLMCFGLPTSTGQPLLRAPSAKILSLIPSSAPLKLPSAHGGFYGGKTLVLGEEDSSDEGVEIEVECAVVSSASEPAPRHAMESGGS